MSILRGLLENEEFLLGAGLLSAGTRGQNLGSAILPSLLGAAQVKKAFKPKRTTNFKTLFNRSGDRIELDLNNPSDAARIPALSSQGYSLSKFDQKDTRTPIQKLAEEVDPQKGDVYNQIIVNKIRKDTLNPTLQLLEAANIFPGDPRFEEAIIASIAKTSEGFQSASPIAQKGKRDNLVIGGNYSVKGLDKILNFADLTNTSPEIFGTTGRVLKLGSDAVKEFESVFGTDAEELNEIDDDVKNLLKNKDFSTLDQLMNSLSINVARVRNPQGKLMKDMIDDAKDDTNFKGLGGVVAVRQKLSTLYNELEDDARQKFELAGFSEERINNILDQKRKEFNQKIGMVQKSLVLDEDGIYRYK
jgi:hypothetical protein